MAYIRFSGGHHLRVPGDKQSVALKLAIRHRRDLPPGTESPFVLVESGTSEVLVNPDQVAYIADDKDFEESFPDYFRQ